MKTRRSGAESLLWSFTERRSLQSPQKRKSGVPSTGRRFDLWAVGGQACFSHWLFRTSWSGGKFREMRKINFCKVGFFLFLLPYLVFLVLSTRRGEKAQLELSTRLVLVKQCNSQKKKIHILVYSSQYMRNG
jgi:hypothetical protein